MEPVHEIFDLSAITARSLCIGPDLNALHRPPREVVRLRLIEVPGLVLYRLEPRIEYAVGFQRVPLSGNICAEAGIAEPTRIPGRIGLHPGNERVHDWRIIDVPRTEVEIPYRAHVKQGIAPVLVQIVAAVE